METAETLLTSAWRELSSEDKFRRYLSVLGLPREINRDRIEQRLKREFPDAWKEFQTVVERRVEGNLSDDVYTLKNQNLRFSLLVTISERANLHAKAFSWFESISDPISSILDVGCENGFLTCLFALRWPGARVIGIDVSAAAVDRARELASRLKLQNITFLVVAVEDIPKHLGAESFDLITTITMLHDAGLLPPDSERQRRTADIFKPIIISPLPSAFSAIAPVLRQSNARWISIERCTSPATFSAWCQSLHQAGLGIDCRESVRVPCGDDFLTIVVAGHDRPRLIDFKMIHGLWMSHEFNRWSIPGEPPWTIRDQQAEAIFAQLNPKTCIDRIVASLGHGQEVQRLEVWEAGTFCMYYHAIHPAMQTHLQFRSVTELSAMRDHWKATAAELRKSAPVEARFEEFHLNT